MKFLVDEMPFWESDCPFYNGAKCTLDNSTCIYMSYPAGHRDEQDCKWLTTKESGGFNG